MGNPYAGMKKKDFNGSSYYDFSNYDNVEFFKFPKEGAYAFDIIPFPAKSKANPLVRDKEIAIGDLVPSFVFYTHRGIGPNKKSVICPARTLGKPCPICEEYDKAKKAFGYDSKEAKALKATERVVFNVVDADDDENTLKVFEVSFFLFAKELNEEAENYAKKHNLDIFDYAGVVDPAEAMTINFRTVKEKGPTGDFDKFKAFSFEKRSKKLKGLHPISFDECIVVLGYDELSNIFYGADEEAEEVETKEVEKEVEERPRKQHKEEVEEEEKPKSKKIVCPEGYKFGVDTDAEDECEKCEVYSECMAAFKENRRKNRS